MSHASLAILNAGLVTSVGLSASAVCAAVRAGLTNHSETRFIDSSGDPIIGAEVALDQPWRGREKLVQMLRLAIAECLEPFGPPPQTLPLLLCVAEQQRAGRQLGLNDRLLGETAHALGIEFHSGLSTTIPCGRVGVAVALLRARELLGQPGVSRVLVAAADSLLQWPTLATFEEQGRLLTAKNADGFIPGEAAGAVMLSREAGGGPQLSCTGLGFSEEAATVSSTLPLRADGLATAIKSALHDAGCGIHDIDFRITDNSGEEYYFREAALALSRTLRRRRTELDIWHPAECIGETGATIGVAILSVALAACRKGYTLGNRILIHAGTDAGQRGAAVLQYGAMSS